MRTEIYADWNPWHGCTKISPGCKYCYVYRQDEMYGTGVGASAYAEKREISIYRLRKNVTAALKSPKEELCLHASLRIFCLKTQTRGAVNAGK